MTDGHTYERSSIQKHFDTGKITSPMTNEVLFHMQLTPNIALRGIIEDTRGV